MSTGEMVNGALVECEYGAQNSVLGRQPSESHDNFFIETLIKNIPLHRLTNLFLTV